MAIRLTDFEITQLLEVAKPVPADFRSKLKLRPKRGHVERDLEVKGEDGSRFKLILRMSLSNPLSFSAILGYQFPSSNQVFRLRRYNGRAHEHTNVIEKETFYDFHVHEATERYQELGGKEDGFAEPTDRFVDLDGAIDCLMQDCNFVLPPDPQLSMSLELTQ